LLIVPLRIEQNKKSNNNFKPFLICETNNS
jgi:hypothetical protein